MFSIGEFSKITRLPIKTLRFYHERGLLVPARVEAGSGYRFYDESNIERARIIVALRSLEFSLDQIIEILTDCSDDEQLVDFLKRRRDSVKKEIGRQKTIANKLDLIIQTENTARKLMATTSNEVQIIVSKPMIVAGIRMRGRYSDCGKGFSQLGKSVGRYIAGKAMCLLYDAEYREDDADFEPCFPVKKIIQADGIHCRELPSVRCLSLVHRGPYDQSGPAYQRLIEFAKESRLELQSPSREIYIKGPGMIFRGNPKKYVTEIQIPITE